MRCVCGWSWPEISRRGLAAALGTVLPGLAGVSIQRLARLMAEATAVRFMGVFRKLWSHPPGLNRRPTDYES